MIANSKSNLKRHIKSSLSKHGTSVHERIKYDCEQCAHKASQKSHLFVTKVSMSLPWEASSDSSFVFFVPL